MKKRTTLLLTLALAALDAAAGAYREYDPLERYLPRAEGDRALTDTYRYWKDPAHLDYRMAGNPEENWKLNRKFMDPPFNKSIHGGHFALDRGEDLVAMLNRKGRFGACLGARSGRLKGVRTGYPRYRADLKRVVALEEMIEICAAREGLVLQNGSYDNSAVSLYLASLCNGMPVAVKVENGPMKAAFERGRRLFHLKSGAFNFACASCHTHNPGKHLRGAVITTPYGDTAHYPVYSSRYLLQSLHLRFAECNLDSRTQPLRPGSPAYTDLEVFLAAMSNGYPVSVPSERD